MLIRWKLLSLQFKKSNIDVTKMNHIVHKRCDNSGTDTTTTHIPEIFPTKFKHIANIWTPDNKPAFVFIAYVISFRFCRRVYFACTRGGWQSQPADGSHHLFFYYWTVRSNNIIRMFRYTAACGDIIRMRTESSEFNFNWIQSFMLF